VRVAGEGIDKLMNVIRFMRQLPGMRIACERTPRIPLFAVLLSQTLYCQAGGKALQVPQVPDGRALGVDWTRLRFEGNRFGVSLTTTLDLAESSRGEMQAPPYAALGDEGFQRVAGKVVRLDIDVVAESALERYTTQGRVWFAAGNIAVLQRERVKPGPGGSRKVYRYAGNGAMRIRVQPNNRNEGQQPPVDWTKIKQSFYPYDLVAAGCDTVTSPELLIYRASSGDPSNGGRAMCVFNDDALYRVWLVPVGEAWRDVDYAVKAGGAGHQVNGKREVLKLSLRVEPISPGADPAAFELLELRGAIAIYLDAGSRLPVLIAGERAGIGELEVRLVEADLRE
jgi:hypothetical protein